MEQFVSNNENIKLSITEVTEKLNECITEWYTKNFPEVDLGDFTGCCNEDEINLLVECYNIFSENKNLQSPDYDFINALLIYYYNLVVLEYYVNYSISLSIDKYLKIVDEKKNNLLNRTIFIDNYGNKYRHLSKRDRPKSSDIESIVNLPHINLGEVFYIRSKTNNLRETDPYIYRDEKLTKKVEHEEKVKPENYMVCFESMLTEQTKKYYELLLFGEEDWISQIRRKFLNMNPEDFDDYKGGKKIRKNTKKTKRNLKKYVKKSRKNKGKKRVNKIKIYMP